MCGITGIFNFNGEKVSKDILKSMTDVIKHRGPDGEGFFVDGNVGFGHRRLAIIDLSDAGSQPMTTSDGNLWITYNGEVYNFQEIKKELIEKGYKFKSRTDVEAVLYAYNEWSIDCIKKFNGMFAFGLWDVNKKKGYLVRDRYGIKPLYYYKDQNCLIFASEIKAILEYPGVKIELDYKALSEYFTFQNILSDRTFFKGIKLLGPGSYLEFGENGLAMEKYWDYDFVSSEMKEDKEAIIRRLREVFRKAVVRQMVSDVPVASYLSSGMDSGSITAIAAQNNIDGILRTFTCGFDMAGVEGYEKSFDERGQARMMAKHFNTEHHETEVNTKYMEEIMPKLIYHLEDFRMGMSFPNFAITNLVSKHNKVVLGGSGGDELFCGYPWRYNYAVGNKSEEDYADGYYEYWQRLMKDKEKKDFFSDKVYSEIRDYSTKEVFGRLFRNSEVNVKDNKDCINNVLQFEIKTFLHGLFVIEDKISMAHSLETRVPFMDNELVDLAMRIPLKRKLKNYDELMRITPEKAKEIRGAYVESINGKLILREAMQHFIPKEIAFGKKQGFSAPVAEWFRKQGRDYVESVILSERALERGIFNPEFIKRKLEEHFKGGKDHRLLVWSLLCFEHWCRIWLDGGIK